MIPQKFTKIGLSCGVWKNSQSEQNTGILGVKGLKYRRKQKQLFTTSQLVCKYKSLISIYLYIMIVINREKQDGDGVNKVTLWLSISTTYA